MKKIVKGMCVMLTAASLLTACGKSKVVMEDYVRSNPVTWNVNGIMKSDTGYYYGAGVGQLMSLHYYDIESGQNIFLCNKPECLHEGDDFCTATSDKYTVISTCMYGEDIYMDVVETTDTEYLCKLLKVSGDGTKLSEVITYQTVNRTSVSVITGDPMMIHRGKVVLPYRFGGKNGSNQISGTYIYDLASKKLDKLEELDVNSYWEGRERFTGYGDYIYFNTSTGRKNTLSRYCLTDGSIEDMELLVNYQGKYEVLDDNTIIYNRGNLNLYEYNISTKESIDHGDYLATQSEESRKKNEIKVGTVNGVEFTDMVTDGTNFYVTMLIGFHDFSWAGTQILDGQPEYKVVPKIHVYNDKLEHVVSVTIDVEKLLGRSGFCSLAVLDDVVYLKTAEKVFSCTKEEFLTGEPDFEELYELNVVIRE